ncbi:MAG: 50S ribosomal protein L17 [Candidatus Omnitrophota bacterium]
MRHRKKKGRLSRKTGHRKAMLRNMANSLFKAQRIETTLAKAKALRSFVEPIITIAKKSTNSLTAKRRIFQKLCDRDIVKILFDSLLPLYKDKKGGYTRIMRTSNRKGDGAQLAVIELTERTISDEKLLRMEDTKEKVKKTKEKKVKEKFLKDEKEPEGESGTDGKVHSAPDVKAEGKEKRLTGDVKKEKALAEQKKVSKKGIFKRFQRKSMG